MPKFFGKSTSELTIGDMIVMQVTITIASTVALLSVNGAIEMAKKVRSKPSQEIHGV